MSYPPQGFLFSPPVSLALQPVPSFGSGVILGPRPDPLGRASSGSAFAPYSGSSAAAAAAARLSYGAEPRTPALGPFVSPGYDPSGSLDYHPFGALGPYPYGDPAYRKNATRDATATLKAWLSEHRKNPYPTKGEKIMLAIITKMTLTQVSTWFANARRRLKKENKMTWTPRNRSEDEEDDDNVDLERNDEDEEPVKRGGGVGGGGGEDEPDPRSEAAVLRSSSDGDSCVSVFRDDVDFKDCGTRRPPPSTGAPPQGASEPECTPSGPLSKERTDSCGATQGPNVAPKPKLWSLAEIATSSDKSRACDDSSQSGGPGQARTPFPHSPVLPRHLYYPSPFIPGYSSYGPLGPLHGGSHLNGLQQTMLQRAEAKLRAHELKKGATSA